MLRALVIALALSMAACEGGVAAAQDLPDRLITVRGEASVPARPDRVEVVAGVVSRAVSAADALAQNNAATKELFALLNGRGIAGPDLQTVNFSVSPEVDRGERGAAQPRIVGYTVTNEVSVTLHDVDKLGDLLDALVGAGANRLRRVRFSIGEVGPLADEARGLAVADARRRALLYAEAAGVRLGRVRSIAEPVVRGPEPRLLAAEGLRAASQVPIAPGELSVGASVTLTYEIE